MLEINTFLGYRYIQTYVNQLISDKRNIGLNIGIKKIRYPIFFINPRNR